MFDFQNFLLRFSLTELKPTQHTHDISKRTYQQPRPLTNMPIPPLLHCLHVFFYLDVLWQQNTTISVTGSNSQMNNCTTLEPPHTPPAINVEAQKCAPCLINVVGGALHQQTMLPRHGGTFLLLLCWHSRLSTSHLQIRQKSDFYITLDCK